MRTRQHPAAQAGLTLVELLVAMAIGLIVTLAVTSVVLVGENHKRATTAINDANQSGSYAAYLLDRALRSAGSGFTQAWDLGVFGCRLNIRRGGSALLPRTAAFPAPFAGVPQTLNMAPVLIQRGDDSDVLVVMGGNAAAGDIPRPILSAGADENSLRLNNTIGLQAGDIGLVSREGVDDCLIEQVSAAGASGGGGGESEGEEEGATPPNDLLTLGGTYLATTGKEASLSTLVDGGNAFFSPVGRAGANNVQFQMFGVDGERRLLNYDLMHFAGSDSAAVQALADGVVTLRAVYALDANGDGRFNTADGDRWAAPDEEGYDIQSLMDTPATARQVLAVRVALVLRSTHFEKPAAEDEYVSPASLTLFGDLPEAQRSTYTIATEDRQFRHRVVDLTVPLRNMLLLPTS